MKTSEEWKHLDCTICIPGYLSLLRAKGLVFDFWRDPVKSQLAGSDVPSGVTDKDILSD